MRIAILELVKTHAGFELEFDRIIIEELKKQGHEPVLFLPENSRLEADLGIPIEYMAGGAIVNYENVGRLTKFWWAFQRELRRVKWFNSAYAKAQSGEVDAIILTTATYRYLRSLHKSKLKNSPIPVIFIFLGVNPQEKKLFLNEARKCATYENIKLKITSLRNDFTKETLSNIEIIPPPVIVPAHFCAEVEENELGRYPIKIGFFGHYRKGEKDVEGILQAFLAAKLGEKAKLVVQAAPSTAKDAKALDKIMQKYVHLPEISFIHGKLVGEKWNNALQAVDVVFLPYTAKRYLYNWSGVYFNAIGFYKPVLVTKTLNPEVLAKYEIGMEVELQDMAIFQQQLQEFVQSYEKKKSIYKLELARANKEFAHKNFIGNLLGDIEENV